MWDRPLVEEVYNVVDSKKWYQNINNPICKRSDWEFALLIPLRFHLFLEITHLRKFTHFPSSHVKKKGSTFSIRWNEDILPMIIFGHICSINICMWDGCGFLHSTCIPHINYILNKLHSEHACNTMDHNNVEMAAFFMGTDDLQQGCNIPRHSTEDQQYNCFRTSVDSEDGEWWHIIRSNEWVICACEVQAYYDNSVNIYDGFHDIMEGMIISNT